MTGEDPVDTEKGMTVMMMLMVERMTVSADIGDIVDMTRKKTRRGDTRSIVTIGDPSENENESET